MAEAPARLYGLYPRKGAIAIGSDGDFTLVDPGERWTIRQGRSHRCLRLDAVRGRFR